MKYILTQEEFDVLIKSEAAFKVMVRLEDGAKQYIERHGCNAERDNQVPYCDDCPYASMGHHELAFPHCIAGKYRGWPK